MTTHDKKSELVAIGLLQMIVVTVAFAAGYGARAVFGPLPQLSGVPVLGAGERQTYPLLAQVRSLLEAHFIGTLPDEKTLEYGAVSGLVASLKDPYTVFVEPEHHELETQSLQGEFGGVGVEIGQNDAGEVTLSPYPDSPAAAAGLQRSDVLVAVDGTRLAPNTPLDQVTAMVRGPIGTSVVLTVRHAAGTEASYTIVRQRIELPSVRWHMVDGQPDIGLIAIERFSDRTPAEVDRALSELSAQGARRYVLDLRNDGGGILDAAIDVAGRFLDGGVVMYESQRGAPERVYTAPQAGGLALTAPLAVLVNHNTASAAEILAGALLDRERAPLIGQATYGKGSVQLVYDLPDGSSLHVTAFKWYTPKRRQLEQTGLPPTFSVEPGPEGTDAELTYALEYLNSTAQAGTSPAR
jgi:carboxyl-terminal processing protease